MDIVTLGAALNGSAEQTKSYVEGHFVAGTNIQIDTNSDGTQTISATGEVSSEDTYARTEIANHIADEANPHSVTASQVGLGNVDNTADLDKPISTAAQTALDAKVDKVTGKGLSTNDFTTAYKDKLNGIEAEANKTVVDSVLSDSSTNPVQNKVVKEALDAKVINDSTITIKKNNTTIDSFTTNASQGKVINITVPTTASDVDALSNTTKYASSLSLTINSSTFVMTGQLKDQNGDNLGTVQTIDLPLESVVVGGSYNSQTKKVVLTLQNGNTIEFSVADLVSGLQTELSASNKLNPAYINYDSTHRAVSDTEKSTWNGKQNALNSTQLAAVNSGINSAKVEQIENNILSLTQYGGGINKFQVTATTTTVNGITFTVNADKTITATGSIADSSKNAIFTMSTYTAVSGDVLSEGFTEASRNAYVYARGGSTSLTTVPYRAIAAGDIGVQREYACVITADTVGQVNITFKPMICNSDIYAKSGVYQPYALSNVELTAKEQVNENNILSIQNWVQYNCLDTTHPQDIDIDNSELIVYHNASLKRVVISCKIKFLLQRTSASAALLVGSMGSIPNYTNIIPLNSVREFVSTSNYDAFIAKNATNYAIAFAVNSGTLAANTEIRAQFEYTYF